MNVIMVGSVASLYSEAQWDVASLALQLSHFTDINYMDRCTETSFISVAFTCFLRAGYLYFNYKKQLILESVGQQVQQ